MTTEPTALVPPADERRFPLQLSYRDREKMGAEQVHKTIPWSTASKAYPAYCRAGGSGQSLERLAERGGFSHGEMDMFFPAWREDVDEIAKLKARIATLTAALIASAEALLDAANGYRNEGDHRTADTYDNAACAARLAVEGRNAGKSVGTSGPASREIEE